MRVKTENQVFRVSACYFFHFRMNLSLKKQLPSVLLVPRTAIHCCCSAQAHVMFSTKKPALSIPDQDARHWRYGLSGTLV
jgi:hypothetical protein